MAEAPCMVMKNRRKESEDVEALVEDELLMLRHSGEIPEIAFHQSLYYLLEDADGPRLQSIPEDALRRMKKAVFDRYRVIVLRDMKPENRDLSLYRGVARSIMNYSRLERFCQLEDMDISEITAEAAHFLKKFLENELDDVRSGRRESCINCKYSDLKAFASKLGLDTTDIPQGIEAICPEKGVYDA